MTITKAQAQWQLMAAASTTANQGSGTITLGNAALQLKSFTTADIAYGMRITSNAISDVATLTISSGAVAQTTGTPEVTRWGTQTGDLSGEDFEGITLDTLATFYALELSYPTGQGDITVAASVGELPDVTLADGPGTLLQTIEGGLATAGTLAFTFAAADNYVDVFIIGQSGT